jgi:hypothetical protein
MRNCALCNAECDSSLGFSRRLTTTFWPENRVEYSPTIVMFFCSRDHRDSFLDEGRVGGEVQQRHSDIDYED